MYTFRKNEYLRMKAVKYAKTYALSPNPNFKYFPLINNSSGDCANFISQCLLAGAIPMNFGLKNPWWYEKGNPFTTEDDKWSISWAVAHSLYWLLITNAEENNFGAKGFEVTDASKLELGDLIFFEDDNKHVFHSSIVTGFDGSKPLISQHSFEALDLYYKYSWQASIYHFVKISM